MRVENIRWKVTALLAFTLACFLLFAYLFQLAGGRFRLSEPYNAKVLVPDAFNIVLNSDVRRDGVTVGRVRAIEPRGGMGEIKFELEKENQQEIFRDAAVRVRTKTLVGESYLDLDPGTRRSGAVPSGATLPLEAVDEAVPLERILDSVDEDTRVEIRRNLEGVGEGLDGRGQDLNDMFGALRPTVANGGRLVSVLKPQRQALADLIGNTGEVLEAFGEREDSLRTLVVDARTTAIAAASRDEQLEESLAELPATLRRAQSSVGTLAAFSQDSTPVVRDLKVASQELAPALRDLEPAARDARRLFSELTPFLRVADPLLAELTPASKSIRELVPPLDANLRQANPALRFLKPYARDFGTFFANVGSIVDTADANGSKGRVFAMIGPNQITSLPPAAREIVDALIETGSFGLLEGTKINSYPKPGTAGDPQPFDGTYPTIEADK